MNPVAITMEITLAPFEGVTDAQRLEAAKRWARMMREQVVKDLEAAGHRVTDAESNACFLSDAQMRTLEARERLQVCLGSRGVDSTLSVKDHKILIEVDTEEANALRGLLEGTVP